MWLLIEVLWWWRKGGPGDTLIFKKKIWVDADGRGSKDKLLLFKIDCYGESNKSLWLSHLWSISGWKGDEITDFKFWFHSSRNSRIQRCKNHDDEGTLDSL